MSMSAKYIKIDIDWCRLDSDLSFLMQLSQCFLSIFFPVTGWEYIFGRENGFSSSVRLAI